jgi:SAM-dependent methyltransferase
MAQPLIRRFVEDLMQVVELPDPVVEFGSLQVEAEQENDLRPLFAGRSFTGSDMREGPGVDRVVDLRRLSFADGEVGTALCLDTLEHCEDPPAACRELRRVTAEGGICVISSVMLFGIHGYPSDYFRFTPEGFRSMLSGFEWADAVGVGDPAIPSQVIGVGARRRLDLDLASLPGVAEAQAEWDGAEGRVRVGPFRLPVREALALGARELPRAVAQRARARLRG